jgi:glycosyltransferase involved in cell wall biosynthesis
LQIVPELETGGAEQTTLDIAASVVAAGGRAIVASRGGRMAGRLTGTGATLDQMPVHSKNPVTILLNGLRLATLIRREQVTILHVRSRAPALSGWLAARLCGIPFLATYHGVYNARSGLKRWYNSIMTRGALVIANSGYTRDHVIAEHGLAPDRVIAIHRGVDTVRFDPTVVSKERLDRLAQTWGLVPRPDALVCLLAARLTRWKGQAFLIEVLGRLTAEEQGKIILVLAGDDQGRTAYRAELEAMISRQGLRDRVRLVGHCDDMPAAYALADIALTPSLEPEAFGRTAVEPQIMGRPVMASDDGGFRETIEPGVGGWLIPPGDFDAWTAALRQALNLEPHQLAAMGQQARERAIRLFSVEAMTASTLAVYACLVNKSREKA